MTDDLAVAAIVFVAALLQVTIVASLDIRAVRADVLLLALLSVALLRGAVVGAVAGFFGGLLVDIVTLDTLGVTSLLLYALAGYWMGRYGETTGRDRAHAPLLRRRLHGRARFAGFVLHFLLGEDVSGQARALRDAAAECRAQPDPRLAPSSRSSRACCAGRAADRAHGGAARLASRSRNGAPLAALPAARPARQEPYRLHAAARVPPRVLAALALAVFAHPLPPSLGARGALG